MVWTHNIGDGSAVAILDADAAPSTPPDGAASLLDAAIDEHRDGALGRALVAYRQVMGLDRENVGAMVLAARLQLDQGESDAAEWLLKRSLTIAPTCIAHNLLADLLLGRRQYDAAVNAYRASLELDPSNTSTWPNLLFALDVHPTASWQLRLAERRRFDDLHCRPLTEAAEPHPNDPDPERVLRVGYVSADLKQHSAAHGFGPVLLGHHRDRFEVHLYDVDQAPENPEDRVSAWFKQLPETTRHDVRGLDDAALARAIRADGIDILVDLSGYSAGGRVLAFARKPAPIQVSGFGYGAGLGIAAMDYLIGDDVLIPEQHASRYRERIMRLPSFMGYEQAPPWPEVGPPPKERNGYTTYGYLGRPVKISPHATAAWAEILRQQPTSRLLLKFGDYRDEALAEQIRGGLVALGVERDRVEIRGGSTRYDHLAAYSDVDVALDPFPHNGGVTVVEATLMGVPTISLLGDYVCGRAGASLMTSFGFGEAVARTPFEYVGNAVSTGNDTWTLADRQALRQRVQYSVLLSNERYASAVEDAYRAAWRRWCAERGAA